MEELRERAKIVRAKRDQIGLTQGELATKAGVSVSYIQKLEAGVSDRNSRPSHLRAVSAALGFDEEYLRQITVTPPTFLDTLDPALADLLREIASTTNQSPEDVLRAVIIGAHDDPKWVAKRTKEAAERKAAETPVKMPRAGSGKPPAKAG